MIPRDTARRPLRVVLLGLGTVGRATAERLIDDAWRAHVVRRGLVPLELVAVGVFDPHRPRGIDLPASVRRTDDLDGLVVEPDIDVIVELIGGLERPGGLVERAISAGKHVVTANKALLARRGAALEAASRSAGVSLRFEAAVGGGIPVLSTLVRDLAGNRVGAVRGIVNGTTNLILSAMTRDGWTFEEALRVARDRGYAELDATADVEGLDAAEKLAILCRLVGAAWPDVDAIRRCVPKTDGDAPPGITAVRPTDILGAAELGMVIKLVAEARFASTGNGVATAVMPVAVPAGSPLGATDGVSNCIEVTGDLVGLVSFRGPGAGGTATSSAVLADLLALSRGEGSTWDPLPEAAGRPSVVDPISEARPWFVASTGIPDDVGDRLASVAVRRSANGVVTRAMALEELRAVLRDPDVHAVLYPVLEGA